MANLAEYFAEHRYKPKYQIGSRVIGTWNKIPFVGTVGNDTVISEKEGPRLTVFIDLPIKYKGTWQHTFIFPRHKDVRPLKNL
jgi:hypothetical protein